MPSSSFQKWVGIEGNGLVHTNSPLSSYTGLPGERERGREGERERERGREGISDRKESLLVVTDIIHQIPYSW